MRKHFFGQLLPGGPAQGVAVLIHLRQQAVVVAGIYHNSDTVMIFGASPQHRRATDINVFDDIFIAGGWPRQGLTKRIEIDNQQVNRSKADLL